MTRAQLSLPPFSRAPSPGEFRAAPPHGHGRPRPGTAPSQRGLRLGVCPSAPAGRRGSSGGSEYPCGRPELAPCRMKSRSLAACGRAFWDALPASNNLSGEGPSSCRPASAATRRAAPRGRLRGVWWLWECSVGGTGGSSVILVARVYYLLARFVYSG